MARDGLVPGAPLNEFLLDVAADIVAASGPPCARTRGPAHVPAPRPRHVERSTDRSRLGAAFKRAERDLDHCGNPACARSRSDGRRLGRPLTWRRSMRTLYARRRSPRPASLRMGRRRSWWPTSSRMSALDRIEALVQAVTRRPMTRDPHRRRCGRRQWPERWRRQLASRRPASFDPEPWIGLTTTSPRSSTAAIASSAPRPRAPHRRRPATPPDLGRIGADKTTAIFFPMREIPDGDDASRDVSIPKTLGRHLAYLHADLPWRVAEPRDEAYSRTGRAASSSDGPASSGCPGPSRSSSAWRSCSRQTRDKQVHADALRLVFNLTTARPYTQSPKPSATYTCASRRPQGTWMPAGERCVLGRMARARSVIARAPNPSRPLEPPPTLRTWRADSSRPRGVRLPDGVAADAWVVFLQARRCRGTGIQPIDVTPNVGDQQGHWWTGGFAAAVRPPAGGPRSVGPAMRGVAAAAQFPLHALPDDGPGTTAPRIRRLRAPAAAGS